MTPKDTIYTGAPKIVGIKQFVLELLYILELHTYYSPGFKS